MTAARVTGLSLPAIAEHFNKDHASVIHAVRRTTERPRLADAAARVSEHVNIRYTARLPRAEEISVNLRQPPAVTFQPDGPVEHAVVAAAAAFHTTPEVLLGADRSRAAADARAVAMTAARIHGHSLPTIARHFDRDHTTVLQATRRFENTPPLRDLAAKIAEDLPQQPANTSAGRRDVDEPAPEASRGIDERLLSCSEQLLQAAVDQALGRPAPPHLEHALWQQTATLLRPVLRPPSRERVRGLPQALRAAAGGHAPGPAGLSGLPVTTRISPR